MFRRLIICLSGALALAGLAGLTVPAAALAATTPSREYLALEVAKVPGAMHVVTGTSNVSPTAAENSAHSQCAAYLAAATKVFDGQDCNTAVWVQYGYVAIATANKTSDSANNYAWGWGWGHTEAAALGAAENACKYYNGKACPDAGWTVTPNYAGAEATSGGYISNPLVDAVTWALDNKSTNPLSNTNWNLYCEQAVEEAYGTSGRYYYAIDNYKAQKAAGRLVSGPNAPEGALVFFVGADPSQGHVGLAVGNGVDYYTTDGGTIHEEPLTQGVDYEGWSYAPASWPGR